MANYETLDAVIITAIQAGINSVSALESDAQIRREAEKHSAASSSPRSPSKTPAFRFVDRRLQALRKKRIIHFTHFDGWHIPASSK